MKTAGLTTWVDPAGNVFGGLGAAQLQRLDARRWSPARTSTRCRRAARLDGALGVMAGLECLHAIRETGAAPTAAAGCRGVE